MNTKIGRNFEFFTPCDFIAAIIQHVPDDDFQLVGYYGRADQEVLEAAPLYAEEVKVRTWHCRVPEHYLQFGGSSGTGLDLGACLRFLFWSSALSLPIKSGNFRERTICIALRKRPVSSWIVQVQKPRR
jgi:hypothetical protein